LFSPALLLLLVSRVAAACPHLLTHRPLILTNSFLSSSPICLFQSTVNAEQGRVLKKKKKNKLPKATNSPKKGSVKITIQPSAGPSAVPSAVPSGTPSITPTTSIIPTAKGKGC
jgi:hypothetical protein